MRIVYTTTNPRHVALLEMALREAGVEFYLENAAHPAVPSGFLVRDEDADKAKRAIEEALQRMGEGPKRS